MEKLISRDELEKIPFGINKKEEIEKELEALIKDFNQRATEAWKNGIYELQIPMPPEPVNRIFINLLKDKCCYDIYKMNKYINVKLGYVGWYDENKNWIC